MADSLKNHDFPTLQNDLLIRAAYRQKVNRVPVWIMRQAGRYLPEFREMRVEHDFFKICRSPELACEVTLQPLRRFDLDAAIIFSDILVIPQALGMEVVMKPGSGPHFPITLKSPNDLATLDLSGKVNDRLKYVFDAITLTRHKINGKVPLIGFSGGPWTLMCYMIDGGGSPHALKSRRWLYEHKQGSDDLLTILTDTIIDYLIGQIDAGAQAIQLFETNAGLLSDSLFQRYLAPHLEKISGRLSRHLEQKGIKVPLILFAKGVHYAMNTLPTLGFDVISLDWTFSPKEVRNGVLRDRSVQGNLDPCALYLNPEELREITEQMVTDFGPRGYIANLGHGITPETDPENVREFINTVHSVSSDLISSGIW